MSELNDVAPEDLPEVVRIASELHEEDRTREEERELRLGWEAAAGEIDVPPEYLERAVDLFQQSKVVRANQARRHRVVAALGVGFVLLIAAAWAVFNQPPIAPVAYDFESEPSQRWVLQFNPESNASVEFPTETNRGGVAVINVRSFGESGRATHHFVNLNTTDVSKNLGHHRSVSLVARGDGLRYLRIYLEASETERWRSPAIRILPAWTEHNLELSQFDYQTRSRTTDQWRLRNFRQPRDLRRISFKVGYYVNEVDATGTITIDDLLFK